MGKRRRDVEICIQVCQKSPKAKRGGEFYTPARACLCVWEPLELPPDIYLQTGPLKVMSSVILFSLSSYLRAIWQAFWFLFERWLQISATVHTLRQSRIFNANDVYMSLEGLLQNWVPIIRVKHRTAVITTYVTISTIEYESRIRWLCELGMRIRNGLRLRSGASVAPDKDSRWIEHQCSTEELATSR